MEDNAINKEKEIENAITEDADQVEENNISNLETEAQDVDASTSEEIILEAVDNGENTLEGDGVKTRKKKSKKIKAFIIMSAVILVALVAAVGALIYFNSPKVLARYAISGAIEDLFERDELALFGDTFDNGSLGFEYSDKEGEMKGKMYFSNKAFMLQNLEIKAEGKTLTADIYSENDYMYVESEELFDGNAYGVVRGEMKRAFQDSIFYDSDTDYCIDDEGTKEALEELMEAYDKKIDEDIYEELESIGERYIKKQIKLIEKYAIYEKGSSSIREDDKTYGARRICIILDEYAVKNISEEMIKMLQDDEQLEEFIKEYGSMFDDLLRTAGIMQYGEDEKDLYEELTGDYVSSLKDISKSFKGEIRIESVISPISSKMYSLCVEYYNDNVLTRIFSLDFGKQGARNTTLITAYILGGTLEFVVEEDDKYEYISRLVYTDNSGTQKTLLVVDMDKDSEKLKITLGDGDSAITISGRFEDKRGVFKVTFDKITGTAQDSSFGELELVFDRKDSIPKHKKRIDVKNVMELTEKDIDDIIENLDELITIPQTPHY